MSTKQIVFLQRPCLPQKMKKKESKVRDSGHISRFSLGDTILKGSFYSSWVGSLLPPPRAFRAHGAPEPLGKLVTPAAAQIGEVRALEACLPVSCQSGQGSGGERFF